MARRKGKRDQERTKLDDQVNLIGDFGPHNQSKRTVMKILYFAFGMCITLGLGIAALYWTQSATASHLDILFLLVAGALLGLPTGYAIAGIGDDDE